MSQAANTETTRVLRLYESTLRAIARRTEEPGSALIASRTLARITAERQERKAP
jgi:hypothetical protein